MEGIQFRQRAPGGKWISYPSPADFKRDLPYHTDIIKNYSSFPSVSVYHVGYSHLSDDDRYFNHVTKRFKLVYVLEGGGWFNGMPVRAGQGFLMWENHVNSMSADIRSDWSFIYLSFTGNAVPELLRSCGFGEDDSIFDIPDLSSIRAKCFDVIYSLHPERITELYLLSLLFDLLSLNKQNQAEHEQKSVAKAEGVSEHVYKAVKYMSKNYRSQIDVSDVARAAHVSEKYLRLLIKQETGKSVRQYLTDIRLGAAKTLISNSRYTFSEIAALSGFGEYRNFVRIFKKKYGVTPTELRQRSGLS